MPKIVAQKIDWIRLGYVLFAEQGINGIVIEKMAKNLACNKSSFYWHFKSKIAFVDRIVDYWIQMETNQIIEEVESQSTPKKKYHIFLKIVFKLDPHLEFIFFLKRYGRTNDRIRKIVNDVDNQRLTYVANLFVELGENKKEATFKASIFYKYLIGYHEMYRYKEQPKNYITTVKKELNKILVFLPPDQNTSKKSNFR